MTQNFKLRHHCPVIRKVKPKASRRGRVRGRVWFATMSDCKTWPSTLFREYANWGLTRAIQVPVAPAHAEGFPIPRARPLTAELQKIKRPPRPDGPVQKEPLPNDGLRRGKAPAAGMLTAGNCSQANLGYFIRSRILARAARAHSSSNWPPGAPLTPIAPIAVPPAMMVTPPVA